MRNSSLVRASVWTVRGITDTALGEQLIYLNALSSVLPQQTNVAYAYLFSLCATKAPTGWQTTGDLDGWSTQWASEILPTANNAIMEVEIGNATHASSDRALKCTWPVAIDSDYTKSANETAKSQLAKAGYRLAAVLVAIFEGH